MRLTEVIASCLAPWLERLASRMRGDVADAMGDTRGDAAPAEPPISVSRYERGHALCHSLSPKGADAKNFVQQRISDTPDVVLHCLRFLFQDKPLQPEEVDKVFAELDIYIWLYVGGGYVVLVCL